MNKEQQAFVERLSTVSDGLALWAEGQLNAGFTLSSVESKLRRAYRFVETERQLERERKPTAQTLT
jgi:hypothetical protein